MDLVTVVAGSALVVGSVIVLVWALASERDMDDVAARLNLVRGAPTADGRQLALTASARTRLIDPFVAGLGERLRRRASLDLTSRVQRSLELSGLYDQGWTVERMLVIRFLSLGAGVLLAVWIAGQGTGRQSLGLAVLVALIGFLAPQSVLDRKAGERQRSIERALPGVIDQLAVTVEAGLGFDAAMARAADGRSGPLADELARVLQDLRVGVDRDVALERMVERTDVPDLRGFVLATRQSTRHGLPISRVLSIQAAELRDKRRARVEEKAAQLPVKIVFPLVFCILPCLFVVVLGPAALNIGESF